MTTGFAYFSSSRPILIFKFLLLAGILMLGLSGCADRQDSTQIDPLPSWNGGAAKSGILDFVQRVTDRNGPDFVAVRDRIAVFDNDGTLIIEKPTLVQFEFLYKRIRDLAPEHPEWSTTQPFKAVLEDDREALADMGFRKRGPLVEMSQGNQFQDDFDLAVADFLATGKHVRYARRYVELVYAPMIELIRYLEVNNFRVFVVSGGGMDFIRSYSEDIYAIPRERVIGSSTKTALSSRNDRVAVFRKTGFSSINAGRFKPLNIWLHIGRRPIFAVGNSDGDFDMLRFATDADLPSLAVLLRHDDAVREYAYEEGAEKVLATAAEHGWVTVSMRDDFVTLFGAGQD
jgi:hypothetical protein